MPNSIMGSSFSFVMTLYRMKKRAEGRGNKREIDALLKQYPELFSKEFEEFIENVKSAALYLDNKYDESFSSILEVEKSNPKLIN